MLSVLFLCCVAVARGSSESAGEHQDFGNTIQMYMNLSESDTHEYMECMPEKMMYQMEPHQQVDINFIVPSITNMSFLAHCTWNGARHYLDSTYKTIDDKWHIETATVPDIGKTSGKLLCLLFDATRIGAQSLIFEIQITIGDAVNEYISYNRSFSVVHIDQSEDRYTKIPEIYVAENTSMTVFCVFNMKPKNNLYKYTMHRLYANGSEANIFSRYDENDLYNTLDSYVYFQREYYDDNTIVCLQTIIQTDEVLYRTEIKLKYRVESRDTGEESAGAAGAAPSGALSGEPRSGTPDSNHYEEVYDVMYEDRVRIERLQKKLQQEKNLPEPPPLPSLKTIPLCAYKEAVPISPLRRLTPPPSGSLIPASDLYLLKIDSDGYEIPDELRFIHLPIQANDEVV